jgi:hypothetical protein
MLTAFNRQKLRKKRILTSIGISDKIVKAADAASPSIGGTA